MSSHTRARGRWRCEGKAPLIWLCGGCREPILKGMEPGQVENLVFLCNGCGTYNETLD